MRRQLVAPNRTQPLPLRRSALWLLPSRLHSHACAPLTCVARVRSRLLTHTHSHTRSLALTLWLAIALSRLHAVMSAACCCLFNFGFIRFSVLSLLFVSLPPRSLPFRCFGCFAYSSISLCVCVCVEYYEPFIKMFGFLFLSFSFSLFASTLTFGNSHFVDYLPRFPHSFCFSVFFNISFSYCFLLASYRFTPHKIKKKLRLLSVFKLAPPTLPCHRPLYR